ncbi:MAG: hypothetical protein AAF799_30695 [Myxococcota bacterium]
MLPPAASTGPATPSQSTGEDDPSSSGSMPVLDVGPAGPGECVDCSVQIDSMQSGQLEVTGEQVFATAELEGSVVYAMGTFGRGRFIAAADSSLPLQEVTECPLLPWLAGGYEPEPRLLAFGWADEIELGDHVFPASIHLPARYVGAPALLADDYDVVIYFEESAYLDGGEQPSNAELQTVLEFTDAGGGLVVSSEYATPGGGYLTPADIDSVNRILAPLGMRSLPVSLNWGEVDGVIKFPCFPPVG